MLQRVALKDCWREVPLYPPPAFLSKSAEVIEKKGRGSEKERQERLRVRKRKEIKEIAEVKEVRSAGFVRDNTANHTTVREICQ